MSQFFQKRGPRLGAPQAEVRVRWVRALQGRALKTTAVPRCLVQEQAPAAEPPEPVPRVLRENDSIESA